MKKTSFVLLCLVWMTFNSLFAQTWTSSVPKDGETFFLYNEGFGGFMCAGNDWGTRASLSKTEAAQFTFSEAGENTYQLLTSPAYPNGKLTLVDGTEYLDQTGGTDWTFAAVKGKANTYHISSGGSYLYGRDDTKTSMGELRGDAYDEWKVVSLADYAKYVAQNGSPENPVDATFLLPISRFEKNFNTDVWHLTNGAQQSLDVNYRYMEFWNTTFDMYQTLKGLPNGKYRIEAQAFYRMGNSANDASAAATARGKGKEVINAQFYANATTHPFPSIFDSEMTEYDTNLATSAGNVINGVTYYVPNSVDRAGHCFEAGYYKTSFDVIVGSGVMKLGAKCTTASTNQWSMLKGFRLYYLGASDEVVHYVGDYEVDYEPTKYLIKDAPTSITISFPFLVSTDGTPITLKEDHGIKVGTAAAEVTCVDNTLVISGLPQKVCSYTVTIPAGVVGFHDLGVTNTETIKLTYTIVSPLLEESVQGYLYTTVDSKRKFLSRGDAHGTRAIVDDYGVPVEIGATGPNGETTITFLDSRKKLYTYVEGELYTDEYTSAYQYRLTKAGANKYYLYGDNSVSTKIVGLHDGKLDHTSAGVVWQLMTKEDRDAHIARNETTIRKRILNEAGYSEEALDTLPVVQVKSATETGTDVITENYNTETFSREWNFTGLKKGLYKVSLQSFTRNGSNAGVFEAVNAGYDEHLAFLTLNDRVYRINSVMAGKTMEPISDSGYATCTLNDTTYYVPSTLQSASDWLDAGLYDGEYLVYVPTAGKLKITLARNANIISNWTTFRNLTVSLISSSANEDLAVAQWGNYAEIAKQAIDHSAFDAVYEQACQDVQGASIERINELSAQVRASFTSLLSTYASNTIGGYFDLTLWLGDPTFNKGISGWKSGGTSAGVNWDTTTKMCEKYGCQSDMTFTQTFEQMPAGPYTVAVQAFYRTRGNTVSTDDYNKGIYNGLAHLVLGNDNTVIRSIYSDGRYTPGHSADTGGANNMSVPGSLAAVKSAFQQGRYWNAVSTDLVDGQELTLGITLDKGGLDASTWLTFDNFHLYYGNAPRIVLDAEEKMQINHYVPQAEVTLKKTFTEGEWTPLCVPFTTDETSAFSVVGKVLGAQNGTLTVQPVSSIEAGKPYMVKPATTTTNIVFHHATVNPGQSDNAPTPWCDAMLKGNYTGYTFTVDGQDPLTYTTKEVDYSNVTFTYNVENPRIREFLSQVRYDDYSDSRVGDYNHLPVSQRDNPNVAYVPVAESNSVQTLRLSDGTQTVYTTTIPAGADHTELGFLIPGVKYTYTVTGGTHDSQGTIIPTGRLRMIKAVGVSNIRDLGGWVNSKGQKIRYGKIYRGGEFNGNSNHWAPEASLQLLRDLGIRAELDIRADEDISSQHVQTSALNLGGKTDVAYRYANLWWNDKMLSTDSYIDVLRDNVNFILNNVVAGKPLYFHCVWGADRTGTTSMLLEGLLGQPEDQIYKNYELTSFSWAGTRSKGGMSSQVGIVKGYPGETLQDKYVNYCITRLGISADLIKKFQEVMLDDEAGSREVCQQFMHNITTMVDDEAFTAACEAIVAQHPDAENGIPALQKALDKYVAANGGGLDATSLLVNAQFEQGNINGWSRGKGETVSVNDDATTSRCAEIYQKADRIFQILQHMPKGRYTVKVQGFQRVGDPGVTYQRHIAGTELLNSSLFANDDEVTLRSMVAEAHPSQYFSSDTKIGNFTWCPITLNGAAIHFGQRNAYWNVVETELTETDGTLTIGVESRSTDQYAWTSFSNFRIYYELEPEELELDEKATELTLPAEGTLCATVKSNRTLKAGEWTTFCVPFDIPASDFEAVLIPRTVVASGDLTYQVLKPSAYLQAGRPYVVHVSEDMTPTYSNVIIRAAEPLVVPGETSGLSLTGTYTQTTINDSYYLADGYYTKCQNDYTLDGQRAYLTLPARVTNVSIPFTVPTGLSVTNAAMPGSAVYDLQGRPVPSPSRHGLYIRDGKKFVR